jgi:ubiquinone/menaquinone biosynthesis C-methylase UbiE
VDDYKVLDVGCGNEPKGDVNCDLYIADAQNHRNLGANNRLATHAISNFVVCDASHLPFKDRAFKEVVCRQLIEHLQDPFAFLKELSRVSYHAIRVETVHRLGENAVLNPRNRRWFKKNHVSKFNFKWFHLAAAALGFHVTQTYILSYQHLPSNFVPMFRFPYEIGIVIERDQK